MISASASSGKLPHTAFRAAGEATLKKRELSCVLPTSVLLHGFDSYLFYSIRSLPD